MFTFSVVVVDLPIDCILSFLFPAETDILAPVFSQSTDVVVMNFIVVLKFPNVKHGKTVQTSDFISYAVSLLHCSQHFTKKCMENWPSKMFVKWCNWLNLEAVVAQLFFRVLNLSCSVLQVIKYCLVPIWPHNNRTNLYNF